MMTRFHDDEDGDENGDEDEDEDGHRKMWVAQRRRLAAYMLSEAGVREAGDVADGGDRPSTLAKGAAAGVDQPAPCDMGVFFGRGLCRRSCVCLGLAWDGWRRASS